MAMRTESIAVMLAISKTDSEALMKTEAFASELAFIYLLFQLFRVMYRHGKETILWLKS